jgi:DNA replication protein DnaC
LANFKNYNISNQENFLSLPKDNYFFSLPVQPSILFICKCYRELEKIVFDKNIKKLCISGNPSIEKTFLSYYLLYKLAKQGKTVIYNSADQSYVYFFSD